MKLERINLKSSSTSKFSIAWQIIIAILFCITLLVWIILTLFLKAYEKSQPIYSINEYIDNISSDHIKTICGPILENLSPLQDETVVVEDVKNAVSVSTPVKYSRESNSEKVIYYLHDGNSYIEKVTLIPGKNLGFGFKKWTVADEELLLNNLGSEVTLNIPSNYTLYCGDTKVDKSFITSTKIEYELLKEFYNEKNVKFPYLSSYSLGEIVGDINVYAIDNNGNRIDSANLNEEYFSDNCSSDEKNDLLSFINNYIPAYVRFLSNADRNTEGNFSNVIQYVKSGSTLESRLRDAKKSNGFNSSRGDEIESIDILQYMNCGNNYYVCDVQFMYITTGQNGQKTEMTNNMKLLIYMTSSGTLQAVSMAQH